MLYIELITVCSKVDILYTNGLSVQNVEILSVKSEGSYTNHFALRC
jgi:hypothetical protein